jgi:hypothetical protein
MSVSAKGEGVVSEAVKYRPGSRDEVKAFLSGWVRTALKVGKPIRACIEESYWGKSDHFLIAEERGAVVGVSTYRGGRPSHFDLVAVHPDLQRQRIGSGLVERTLAHLVAEGNVPIRWIIENESMRAILRRSRHSRHVEIVEEA